MLSFSQIIDDKAMAPIMEDLALLFADMDGAYAAAADQYGFACTGCTDNCCLTRFYHHTFLELIYLRRGFLKLPPAARQAARTRAGAYLAALSASDQDGRFRHMCPLNQDGLCLLYDCRPMICRLHGIPHEVTPPGRPRVVFRQGCQAFSERCGDRPYHPFDRTPFYTRMSVLETRLKEQLGICARTKKTVAHMLIEEGLPSI